MALRIVAGSDVGIAHGVAPLNALAVVPVQHGGTGAATLTGLLKGNGLLPFTSAIAGVDFVSPSVLGAPSGVATLDSSGQLTIAQIPASLLGGLSYQGVWDAATNTPHLTSGVGTKGYYYKVSVAGSTMLDGDSLWNVGDDAVFNGTVWDRIVGSNAGLFSSLSVTSLTGYMYANGSGLVTSSATIPNTGLANSTITVGGTTVALGDTLTTLTGVTLDASVNTVTNVSLVTGVTGTLGIAHGGTGLTATPTNGQLAIGNGSGFSLATLASGDGIQVTNGIGTVTVSAVNIPNSSLVNSSITLGSTQIFLGDTKSSVTGLGLLNPTLTGTTTVQSSILLGASAGAVGQVLTSQGVGSTPVWTTPSPGTLTSVGLSAPSFLTVTNSPLTANGVIDLSYSGTALPVANGGTGASSLTGFLVGNGGSAFTALATIPNSGLTNSSFTLGATNIALGANVGTVTGVTLSGASLSNGVAFSGGNSTLELNGSVGTPGQFLLSAGAGATPTWTTVTINPGTVTSVALSVPAFLSVTGSPITSSGSLDITLSGTALPVANGGTGTTSLSGLAYGNAGAAFTSATAAQVVAVIGSTAVANSTAVSTSTVADNTEYYMAFAAAASGFQSLSMNAGVRFNPSTGSITQGIQGGSF